MTAPHGSASQTPPATTVHVELPQDQRAPSEARRATRDALISWRLPDMVDSVVLAVSELVTNAVRYGRPAISLELLRRPTQVGVAVHDGEPTPPPVGNGSSPPAPTPEDESGRGLAIVRALGAEVEVEQVAEDGKIVRVDFEAPPVTPEQ